MLKYRTAYTDQPINWAQSTLVSYTGDSAWGDMLVAFDGRSITRDAIGNMLSYNGVTYTWEHGRELATMTDSTGTWTFTYDANGMRTKRVKTNTSGTVTDTYLYVYNGGQLSQMKKNGNVLNFFYDGEGRPAYFTYNNATYYYVTNLQGDVITILDSTGAVMVNYHYDAYGALLQTGGTMAATLGTLNPLTYRGYVYDHETGLYYLQSRYYNPTFRQFISADAYVSTGQGFLGYNMFAYCGNNPVIYSDPTGTEFIDNDKDLLGGGGPSGYYGYYGLSVGGGGYVPNTSAYVTNAVVGANAGGTPDTAIALLVVGALVWELISATNTAASIPNSEVQSKEETITAKQSPQQYNYWSAELRRGSVCPITPLTYSEAQIWVATGNDLLCRNHAAAIGIVKYWPSAKWDGRHGDVCDGYLNHYHLSSAHTNHIWYFGE